MKTWTNPIAATLAILLTLTACTDTAPDEQPQHPQAETAQQVVDAFVAAYAEYRNVEKRPVGLAVDSWLRIPDAGLAEAMAALPLPHSAAPARLSPTPWTLGFLKPIASFAGPGKLLAYIVDGEESHYGLLFVVTVKADGAVGTASHVGEMSRRAET